MNNKTLVFATHNANKVKEVKALLDEFNIKSLSDIKCFNPIPETANTLQGNAILKANYVTEIYKMDCFADDTGLEVKALNNEPGVYSARYAGEENNAAKNNEKLLKNLKSHANRAAQFKTVIALNILGKQFIFEGTCKGVIAKSRKGLKGFGYDPIFIPDGHQKSFAEMNIEEKGKISHRGKAVQKLINFLSNYTW